MMKTRLFAALLVMSAAGVAQAGGQPGSLGVGAEAQLNGLGGASMNYDAGDFHVGAFLGFQNPGGGSNDALAIGGRFFFHLHSTTASDFSIGANLGIASINNPAPDDRETQLFLEPAFQLRAFVVSNVALSFTAGVVIGVMDADRVELGGQLTGAAGVHYYFF
jgi:hypothetical protein